MQPVKLQIDLFVTHYQIRQIYMLFDALWDHIIHSLRDGMSKFFLFFEWMPLRSSLKGFFFKCNISVFRNYHKVSFCWVYEAIKQELQNIRFSNMIGNSIFGVVDNNEFFIFFSGRENGYIIILISKKGLNF